eukprot:jgi/Ulvmu1/9892/UM057_0049.1
MWAAHQSAQTAWCLDRSPLLPRSAYLSTHPSSATPSAVQRSTRGAPLNSIPSSKVQEASAALAFCQSPSRAPVTPRTASEWSQTAQSLADLSNDAPTEDTAEQLICLASSLQYLSDDELTKLTSSAAPLSSFLDAVAASRPPTDPQLYSQTAKAFLHPLLQEAVATDPLLSSAADSAVAAATHACEDSFWHPAAVAAAAHLQLVFCRGHRVFWNLLAHHTDCLHECDAASFAQIAECAAALRVRHPSLWVPLAASANSLALHVSTSDLHACARALGTTIPDSCAIPSRNGASPPENPVATVNLDSMLEVVQWRGGQGSFEAADLPYTTLAVSAIMFRSLPEGGSAAQISTPAARMAQHAPAFWGKVVEQSRTVCNDGYGSHDALSMALACVVAGRYFEQLDRVPGAVAGAADVAGATAEGEDEGGASLTDCRAAVRTHAHEMFRFAALAAVVEGGSADGGEWEVAAGEDGECRIECMQVWLEVLLGCAGARVPLGADLLPGAARVVRAMHGVDELDAGVALAALARCAALEMREADELHRVGVCGLVRSMLADAADRQVGMGPMHVIEVLQLLAYDLRGAVGTGEEGDAVTGWLLGEMKGQLGGLPERWLTRYLRAVAALPGAFAGREGLKDELRACMQSKTYAPRNSYSFSGDVNGEFFADVRHELAVEEEGHSAEWRRAHSRNAAGFSPSEAAEAARCVKALRLFDGGSSVLEALLAVSMGSPEEGAPAALGVGEGGLQGDFQQMFLDELDGLGGEPIGWMTDTPGDAELVASSGINMSEITRERDGLYSSLAAGSMGWRGRGDGEASAGGIYEFEGSYDGGAAAVVAEVMDRTEAALSEVLAALQSADWDADVAVDALIRQQQGEEAAAAGADVE